MRSAEPQAGVECLRIYFTPRTFRETMPFQGCQITRRSTRRSSLITRDASKAMPKIDPDSGSIAKGPRAHCAVAFLGDLFQSSRKSGSSGLISNRGHLPQIRPSNSRSVLGVFAAHLAPLTDCEDSESLRCCWVSCYEPMADQNAECRYLYEGILVHWFLVRFPDISSTSSPNCRFISTWFKCTRCPWPGRTHSN